MRARSPSRLLIPLLPTLGSACFSFQAPLRSPQPGERVQLRLESPREAVFRPPRPDTQVVCPLRWVEGRLAAVVGDSLSIGGIRAMRLSGGGISCSVAYSSPTVRLLAQPDGQLTVYRFNGARTVGVAVGVGLVAGLLIHAASSSMNIGLGEGDWPSAHFGRPR